MRATTEVLPGAARIVALLWGVCAAASIGAQGGTSVYDFESLIPNTDIVGQDGWYSGFSVGNGAFVAVGTTVVNTTQLATIGANDTQAVTRQNDGSFAFGPFTGSEAQAYIQCDLRWNRPEDANGVVFKIGTDLNGNGDLEFGNTLRESVGIRVQNGDFGFDNDNIGPRASRTSLGAGDIGDWYRLRLVMDFSATAGGTGTLFYLNLTRGDSDFSPVVSGPLQVDLMAPGAEVSNWNAISIVVNKGVEFDNLTVSTGLTPVQMLDLLIEQVNQLVTNGTLTSGLGVSLVAKLELARDLVDQGNGSRACQNLRAFINQVIDLQNTGVLSQQEGQALIDAAVAVRDTIGCP